MGRPSKLDKITKKKLLDTIKLGNYYEAACRYAGIDYSTFRRWILKGEKEKTGEYHKFCEELKNAEAEAELRLTAMWQQQMPDDWKAIATFLERRYPEKWGRRDRLEHAGQVKVENEVNIAAKVIADEEASGLACRLLERISNGQDTSGGIGEAG